MRIVVLTLLCSSLVSCGRASTEVDALARELPLAEGAGSTVGTHRRVGVVGSVADSLLISVPARAHLGEAIAVQVSIGSGQCAAPDTTVVTMVRLAATIVPYQTLVTPSRAIVCPAVFFLERRSVALKFLETGEARVRIIVRIGADQRLEAVERRVLVE